MSKIYTVPEKLKVGFSKRESTTNGNLGYVIHYDTKTSQYRREGSFNSWRDKDIEPVEFDNKPTKGFLFSSNIIRGGHYRYDSAVEKVRVYDPRGFDVEISVSNLMHIIEYYTIDKTEVIGELAYAWYGNDLILLPTVSDIYKESEENTAKFNQTFKTKDLVVGNIYETKSSNYTKDTYKSVYLGRFDVNNTIRDSAKTTFCDHPRNIGKQHIFEKILSPYGKCIEGSYQVVKTSDIVSISNEVREDVNDMILRFKESYINKIFGENIYLIQVKSGISGIELSKHLLGRRGYYHENNEAFTIINGNSIPISKIFDLDGLREGIYTHSKYINNNLKDSLKDHIENMEKLFKSLKIYTLSTLCDLNGDFYSQHSMENISHLVCKSHKLADVSGFIKIGFNYSDVMLGWAGFSLDFYRGKDFSGSTAYKLFSIEKTVYGDIIGFKPRSLKELKDNFNLNI